MRLLSPALGLLALFVSHAAATALTYKLMPNERACFYASVTKQLDKIAFYFAVGPPGSFPLTSARARAVLSHAGCDWGVSLHRRELLLTVLVVRRCKLAARSTSTT